MFKTTCKNQVINSAKITLKTYRKIWVQKELICVPFYEQSNKQVAKKKIDIKKISTHFVDVKLFKKVVFCEGKINK